MKFLAVLLLIPLISPLNYVLEVNNNEVYDNACRYNIQGLIYVHIKGEPYERGYQHGYLLYSEIADMIYRWSNVIHNAPRIPKVLSGDLNSTKYEDLSVAFWNQCKNLAMKLFWDDYPDEYRQEVKGIADGARARGVTIYGEPISYEDILTLNEMYELMSILVNPIKGVHLFKDMIHLLSLLFQGLRGYETDIASAFSFSHHCNGFAAVGNATKDGNIVISDVVWCGGWWYSYYIAQRWNVVIDMEPSKGHRLIYATSPGLIWSDEDFYQNDEGLAMIETTFVQGIYKLRGVPLAVRARMALQYGNTIDDVVQYMLTGNTGVMNAQWLIADAEAKEIALFELCLYAYNLERTNNGFFWSANNPFDFRVRREVLGYEFIKAPIFRLAHTLLNTSGYEYYTFFYTPSQRDLKFEELGKQYYGDIDMDVVKTIMHTAPMTDFTSDCKITDGSLIFNNSLWVFFGNPTRVWNTSGLEKLKGARDVPPAGWVQIYGVPYGFKPSYEKGETGKGFEVTPLWTHSFGVTNFDYATLATDGTLIYSAFNNSLTALTLNGTKVWEKQLNNKILDMEARDGVYVVTETASYAFSAEGVQLWKRQGGTDIVLGKKDVYILTQDGVYVESKISNMSGHIAVYGDGIYVARANIVEGDDWIFKTNGTILSMAVNRRDLYVGSADGKLYCLDHKGTLQWSYTAGWCINDIDANDDIVFGSADGNLYSINRDGIRNWVFSTNGSIQGVRAYADVVFATSTDGRFYAVNRSSGIPLFSYAPAYEIEDAYNYITTPLSQSVIATGGKTFFSASGNTYCLDARTTERNMVKNNDLHGGDMVLIGGVLVIIVVAVAIGYAIKKRRSSDR